MSGQILQGAKFADLRVLQSTKPSSSSTCKRPRPPFWERQYARAKPIASRCAVRAREARAPSPPEFFFIPLTCVIRGERLCELFHMRTLGMRENSDGQDIVRSQHRRFDGGFRCELGDPKHQARVAPAASAQVDTFQMMTGAKHMPSEHFADYSFVFN